MFSVLMLLGDSSIQIMILRSLLSHNWYSTQEKDDLRMKTDSKKDNIKVKHKTTSKGKWPWMKENFKGKTSSESRQLQREDILKRRTTSIGILQSSNSFWSINWLVWCGQLSRVKHSLNHYTILQLHSAGQWGQQSSAWVRAQ